MNLFQPLYDRFFTVSKQLMDVPAPSELPSTLPVVKRPLLIRKGIRPCEEKAKVEEEKKEEKQPEEKKQDASEWNYDLLQALMASLGCPASLMELVAIWKTVDVDKDGVIAGEDFGSGANLFASFLRLYQSECLLILLAWFLFLFSSFPCTGRNAEAKWNDLRFRFNMPKFVSFFPFLLLPIRFLLVLRRCPDSLLSFFFE